MKLRSLCFCALLVTACGNPDGKLNADPNSSPNNTNNTNNVGMSCVLDADCDGGEACEAQTCVATCVSDAECGAGEVCREGVNTTQLVCQLGSSNNPINNPINNPDNNLPTLYYNVHIESTTTSQDACEFVDDPGPDIFAVGLEDLTGAQLGWGVVEWDSVQFDGNDFADTSVLDGNPPDLGADNCPDTFDGNVVALGCSFDSWIVVSFVDGAQQPIPLDATADQVIRVYEWGGQCSTGGIQDTYSVNICTDTQGSRSGDISSCSIQLLIDGAGETTGDVRGF